MSITSTCLCKPTAHGWRRVAGVMRVAEISNYDIGKLGRVALPREVAIRHGSHGLTYRPTSLV